MRKYILIALMGAFVATTTVACSSSQPQNSSSNSIDYSSIDADGLSDRTIFFTDKVITLLENNQDDYDAAGAAVSQFVNANRSELNQLRAAGERLSADESAAEALQQALLSKMGPLQERMQALPADMFQHDAVMEAFALFQ